MNDILHKDISDLLGMNALPPDEQATLLEQVSNTVMEAALLRLMTELSDEQQSALDHYLESDPDSEALLTHLLESYSKFETILQEEIVNLKSDLATALSTDTVAE